MINSKNNFEFLKFTIRSFIFFQIKKKFFFLKNGHFLRRNKINNYLKKIKLENYTLELLEILMDS